MTALRISNVVSSGAGRLRFAAGRVAAWMLVCVAVACLVAGCDRKGGGSKAGTDKPGGAAVDLNKPFAIPNPDLSKYSEAVGRVVQGAIDEAKKAPDSAAAIGGLGMICYDFRLDDEAARCFAEAAKKDAADFRWPYYLGIILQEMNDWAQAAKAFEAALALNDNYSAAHVRLGDVLMPTQPDKAEEHYKKALDIELNSARAAYGLGQCARRKGQSDQAMTHFQRAVAIAPDYADAHGALAELLTAAGKTDEAKAHQERKDGGRNPEYGSDPLLEDMMRRGRTPEVATEIAVARLSEGNIPGSVEALRTAIKANPSYAPARRMLGIVWCEIGRFREGEVELRRAMELAPDDADIKSLLGDCLVSLNKLEEAGKLYAETLAKDPNHAPTIWRQGRLRRVENKPDEAIALMKRSLEIDANNAAARYALAETLYAADRLDEARKQLDEMLKLSPNNARAVYLMGWVHRRGGDRAAARSQWQQAAKLAPAFVQAYMELAGVAIEEKDAAEAERVLREGLKHVPDAPDLNNALAWRLAAAPDAGRRNGTEALRYAEKACELTQHQDPLYLDTLAVVFAELGRFEDAATTARKAIDLARRAGMTAMVTDFEARLALFEQRQAYHEPA